ncbi:helix-turn-helix domain-containing protein [Xanthomonas hortorum]|uniref:helix-turn-helix domain-containing protein n=1 Tax=Xanthomonas hortorum TaxID=56454 RepID=UPI001F3EBDBB|nr:helix-turn-helix domain-containing protein [Xanthomonas hortorum]MCE4510322.1 helix-turn-helix domain-containing protein [Xanthomonas hortorum pv. vitians]MCE4520565.1 helix-turn-helix domain-containing protein [Xanthomonas hortorum pv. vitians]
MSQNSTCAPAAESGPEANIIDTSAPAQRARLLAALRQRAVTTLEARRDLNVFVPGVRIFELRQEGHPIVTRLIPLLDDQGRPHSRVAQYSMQQEVA